MHKKIIMHIDGDAFFASVEQAKNWKLKGKPVVTGGERYIASAMSYEAKRKGVTRGMKKSDILKVCPDAVFVASDYVTYTIFARRMYNIVRTYTDSVEEYSIDECFADITYLGPDIAYKIKDELESKLGITFGVGVASTKVLAKIASKLSKPAGLVHVTENTRIAILQSTPIEKVWGIGSSATRLLRQAGIYTAYDFAALQSYQVYGLKLSKPYREIHTELQGAAVLKVATHREVPKSIMSSRSFYPFSKDIDYIYAHLSKHTEEVCEKMRSIQVQATSFSFFIKNQDFRYTVHEEVLSKPTHNPADILWYIKKILPHLLRSHNTYKTVGITVRGFVDTTKSVQLSYFDAGQDTHRGIQADFLYKTIDGLNRKYGEHTLMLGSTLQAVSYFKKESKRLGSDKKVWELPYLGEVA
ncbi:MAG: hypothetical protein RIQ72_561 [Candidatus Parcubacteria bacterium]|jgi:DNA polymerase-4/DNA polymerase V